MGGRLYFGVGGRPGGKAKGMSMKPLWFIAAVAILSGPVAAEDLKLDLKCPGGGVSSNIESSTVAVAGKGGKVKTATVQSISETPWASTAYVEIRGQAVRVLLPHESRPWKGLDEDWVELKKVMVSERWITGSVKSGLIGVIKVSIDRQSGLITINYGDFRGTCAPYDPAERTRRAF